MYVDLPLVKYLNPPVVLFLLFLLSKSNIGTCNDLANDPYIAGNPAIATELLFLA